MSVLDLSRRLLALSQTGLHFSQEEYDRERYREMAQIAGELLALESALSPEKLRAVWLVEDGYATPKVDVRGAVFRGDQVLMVQERVDGKWTLPGGWADLNASPAENAAREVLEEAGIVVTVKKLIACWDKDRQGHPRQPEHVYKLVFLCEATGGELTLSHETDGADWFSPNALPDLCPYRAAGHYVTLAFTHAAQPDLPTLFD